MPVKQQQDDNTKLFLRFLQKIAVVILSIFIIHFCSHKVPNMKDLFSLICP